MIDEIFKFLNSSFISASLSALAGAGLGAWGAGVATARASRKKELSDALRQANGASVLAMTVMNSVYSLKKQHVVPMMEEYKRHREEFQLNVRGASLNSEDSIVRVRFNFLRLTPLSVPLDGLRALVNGGSSMPGMALALLAVIEQAAKEHEIALDQRWKMVEELRASGEAVDIKASIYFGLPLASGGSNLMFRSSMDAIRTYTDDLAFFSLELVETLVSHAKRTREKLLKLDRDAPKAVDMDSSELRASGLVPPREEYESWMAGYKVQD